MKRLGPLHTPEPEAQVWRVERKLPSTVLVAIALQAAGLVAWGAYLEARVVHLERATPAYIQISEKLARLEERIDALRGDVRRMRDER